MVEEIKKATRPKKVVEPQHEDPGGIMFRIRLLEDARLIADRLVISQVAFKFRSEKGAYFFEVPQGIDTIHPGLFQLLRSKR